MSCFVRPGSELAPRLARDGFEIHRVNLLDWYEPVGMTELVRALRTTQPDILHTHSPRDYYVGALATVGTPIRNVGTRHQLHRINVRALKWPFLRRFRAMIAVSDAVREGLLASGIPPERLVTVPNGISMPEIVESPGALRRELGLDPDDAPVVGCVGRLCPTKGLDTLLWAVSLLRRRWPALQVVFIGGDSGDNGFARRLRGMALDLRLSVRFCGYRDAAARLLPAFDLLAVPSRAEPFGLVTVEALARGVPVVVTRSGGSREIVRDEREGLLVPPDDPEALAEAIHRLLADHALRARCSNAGPLRVAERYTLARQVNATELVYNRVLADAPLPTDFGLQVVEPPKRADRAQA